MEGSSAIQYHVINKAETSAGGIHFADEIGDELSKQTLIDATEFIWKLNDAMQRKYVPKISLIIEDTDGVAYTEDNKIQISTKYIENYSTNLRSEVIGVLYHEMVHIWQWDVNGQTPEGLIQGVADLVRLKSNYAPSKCPQPGQGERWDQEYGVTARFLDYCNDIEIGFVAELNKKMKSAYSIDYFVELLGKPVKLLRSEYKAKVCKIALLASS